MRFALAISLLTVVAAHGQTTPTIPPIIVGSAASTPGGVAPGSYLSIRALAPTTVPTTGVDLIDVTGVQVTLTSSASGKVFSAAPIGRPTPGEIWVIVPLDMPLGDATAALSAKGAVVGTATFPVVSVAPGLFTRNITGYTWLTTTGSGHYSSTNIGPALAQNNPVSDGRLNGLANPAVPGQFVTMWATGLGLSSAGLPNITTNLAAGWTIDLAGTTVVPSFVGAHGLGLDQINFQIPAKPPIGCYIPVTLKHGDVVSNTVEIAINSTPGACPHPLGLSYGDLTALDNGSTIWIGQVNLSGGVVVTAPPVGGVLPTKAVASASANFGPADAGSVFGIAGVQLPYDQLYGCQVTSSGAGGAFGGSLGGNAGSPLVLRGPGGQSVQLAAVSGFGFNTLQVPDTLLPFFGAGTWTLTAPGGSNIGSFQRSFTLPPAVSGLNRDELAALRTGDDVTVRWNNQGYGVGDLATVTMAGSSSIATCRTYAFMGIVTLPKIAVPGAGGILSITITPAPYARTEFTVPLLVPGTPSGSVAQTVVNYSFNDVAMVLFH